LLIVPAILIGVTFTWSASQTRSDNKREDRRIAADRAAAEEARQAATLQGYFGEMSGLILREKLLTATPDSAVNAVARTVTLTALRRLDGERKGAVTRFLHEAGLLGPPSFGGEDPHGEVGQDALVSLRGADLRGADFRNAYLYGADLSGADLRGADFGNADLHQANLQATDLSRAQLADAVLPGASLEGANLRGAFLEGADLEGANLPSADLQRADLQRANLNRAGLWAANLQGARLTGADLTGAKLGFADFDLVFDLAKGLDLGRYLSDLTPKQQKAFLDSQEAFLDSLSREKLAKFKLTPEELARIRREASDG
jgi:uncharacterized protein YjbI with pentapeptide repeats